MLDDLRATTSRSSTGRVIALRDRRPPDARPSAAWRASSASSTSPTRGGVNQRPIPRLGGLAIFLGIFVPALAFLDLSAARCAASCSARPSRASSARSTTSAASLRSRSSRARSSAAAIPTASASGSTTSRSRSLGAVDLPGWVGVPLTVLWIVAVMNMVNFLDGMDGLAAGVCAISGAHVRGRSRSRSGKPDAAILSAIVAGACVGFLRHNFFPARIFMGDSGALVLGFTLATVSVAGLLKTASTVVAVPPAARARGPDPRHLVRRRAAAQARPADLRAPTGRTSTTASSTSASPSAAPR